MADVGIVVLGVGEVRHRPTALIARIGVSVTRSTVRQATEDASVGARAVIRALVDAGVAQDDIQTANVSVGPRHEHTPNGTMKLVGYTFTNTVTALVRDLDTSGSVLDAALAAGGDDAVLESVTFTSADGDTAEAGERDHETRARAAAYADARAKAEHLAQLAGVALGSPLSIDETGYAPRDARAPRMMAMAADMSPPIAPGQTSTVVQLRVCFAIV